MIKPNLKLIAIVSALLSGLAAQTGDWPAWGHDGGGTRYSPLNQISASNVTQLKLAWVYHTGDISDGKTRPRASGFEATPIVVDGTMYLCSAFDRVIALDPASGRERWAFDPKIPLDRWYGDGLICRGVSTWPASAGARGERRIFVATQDGRLISVDARTGTPDSGFGNHGTVDLRAGLRIDPDDTSEYHMTSAPAIIDDLVVVGSAIDDNRRAEMPSGVVRAYDVHTGVLRWKFDPLPAVPGRVGAGNAWSTLSVDAERHLVFVPTGSASPDYYGGLRKGDNRYANCVVALHAGDGRMAWAFQLVHHDLWDYDVTVQPALLEVKAAGKTIPAVIAANKTGNVFFLDRETGQPIFPVVEKPVPQTDVPGEETSPTQPFPTTPPVAAQSLKVDDAWGLTASDRQWCREQLAGLRNQGIFTPPGVKGSLAFPGNIGGIAWGGAAVDPKLGLVYVNNTNLAVDVRLIPGAQVKSVARDQERIGYEVSPQEGTPYGMERRTLLSPGKTPCNPPPWGTLSAIESSTGNIRWQVPVGRWPIPHPLAPEWGSPTFAGPIVTAGGLVFDVSPTDNHLSAFDAASGKLLWQGDLPVPSSAMPMTYMAEGKQYLVVAAGGHAKIDFIPRSDAVVAFALP